MLVKAKFSFKQPFASVNYIRMLVLKLSKYIKACDKSAQFIITQLFASENPQIAPHRSTGKVKRINEMLYNVYTLTGMPRVAIYYTV